MDVPQSAVSHRRSPLQDAEASIEARKTPSRILEAASQLFNEEGSQTATLDLSLRDGTHQEHDLLIAFVLAAEGARHRTRLEEALRGAAGLETSIRLMLLELSKSAADLSPIEAPLLVPLSKRLVCMASGNKGYTRAQEIRRESPVRSDFGSWSEITSNFSEVCGIASGGVITNSSIYRDPSFALAAGEVAASLASLRVAAN